MSKIKVKIPYYSQWESPKLVKKFWGNPKCVMTDPKWKKSGAETPIEYFLWSWSLCGFACLKMVLKYWKKIEIPLVATAKLSVNYGVYKVDKQAYEKQDYLHAISPMLYEPFTKFVQEKFVLQSKVRKKLKTNEIIKGLQQGNLIIASVNSNIRDSTLDIKNKGGHLVLVIGHEGNNLFLHNPSGLPNESQENFKISIDDFNSYFAERGIILQKPL